MKKIIFLILTAVILIFVYNCSKKDTRSNEGKLQFSIAIKSDATLKAAVALPSASYILVSIETNGGKSVYESEKIELFNFNGSYSSKTISLSPGNFVLTKFLVLDNTGNAIYATPKKDSPKAYLVTNPLDINFSINADEVTQLSPEVLSTANSTPDAFGYFDATFRIVKTFDFLVSVFVYDEASKKFQLTDASITISDSVKDLYTLPLEAKTNMVTVNDGLSKYKIKITKPGYEIYSTIFPADSLKAKFGFPLIVNLTKSSIDLTTGLVAYYPFNGNANDESGNGNNGIDYGPSNYITTAKGIARSFSNPDASNALDYVTVPNTLRGDYTISMKVMYTSLKHFNTLIYLSSGKSWVFSDIWISLDPHKKLTYIQESQDLRAEDYSHQAIIDIPQRLNSIYVNSDSIQPNQYYDFAATYSNNTLNIYLNGNKYMTYSNINAIDPSTNTLIIGVCPNNTTNLFYYPLEGVIDELRFYNRALPEESIKALAKL